MLRSDRADERTIKQDGLVFRYAIVPPLSHSPGRARTMKALSSRFDMAVGLGV